MHCTHKVFSPIPAISHLKLETNSAWDPGQQLPVSQYGLEARDLSVLWMDPPWIPIYCSQIGNCGICLPSLQGLEAIRLSNNTICNCCNNTTILTKVGQWFDSQLALFFMQKHSKIWESGITEEEFLTAGPRNVGIMEMKDTSLTFGREYYLSPICKRIYW